jgi:hypothetical protein
VRSHKPARHSVKIELDGIVALAPLAVGIHFGAPSNSSVDFRLGSLLTKGPTAHVSS